MTTTQMKAPARPVQYQVAVAIFITCTAISVVIGLHHLFWMMVFGFTPAGVVDFSSPIIFGHANVTAPLLIVTALVAVFTWQLVDVEA
ncbi:hypothetical protein Voja6_00220 [Pseudomonas phage vB_PpuM-Voja-6]